MAKMKWPSRKELDRVLDKIENAESSRVLPKNASKADQNTADDLTAAEKKALKLALENEKKARRKK